MAVLKFTNPATVGNLYIDVDAGERFNTYAKWVIAAGEAQSIDEADINPFTDFALRDSLRSGQLTVTESDLNNLTLLAVKNFLASGLDLDFKTPGVTSIASGRLVQLDTTTGLVRYATASGVELFGVAREAGTTSDYIRVKTAGSVTGVVSNAVNIATGDKLTSDTTGRVISTTTRGDHYIGVSTTDTSGGQSITFTISKGTVA